MVGSAHPTGYGFLTLTPSMQPSIAAFIGRSKNLFEGAQRVSFFAPMKARSAGKSRSDPIVGWPFLWFRFFWPHKRNEHAASARKKVKQLDG